MLRVVRGLKRLGVIIVPPAHAGEGEAMSFAEAMGAISSDRLAAEMGVRIAKRHLGKDPGALTRLELEYEAARQAFNAVIVQLLTALGERTEEAERASLEERILAARAKREAFCASAEKLVPPPPKGNKSVIATAIAVVTNAVLVGAVKWFFDRRAEADRLRRQQLMTRLEDERWRAFGEISG